VTGGNAVAEQDKTIQALDLLDALSESICTTLNLTREQQIVALVAATDKAKDRAKEETDKMNSMLKSCAEVVRISSLRAA
jgi:hypothetical protein